MDHWLLILFGFLLGLAAAALVWERALGRVRARADARGYVRGYAAGYDDGKRDGRRDAERDAALDDHLAFLGRVVWRSRQARWN